MFYSGWRHDFKEKVNALRGFDLLISGGGGFVQDTYPYTLLFQSTSLLFINLSF